MYIKSENLNLNRFDGSLNNFSNCDGIFIDYIGINADGEFCYFNYMNFNAYLKIITDALINNNIPFNLKNVNNRIGRESFEIEITYVGVVGLILTDVTIGLKNIRLEEGHLLLNNDTAIMDARAIIKEFNIECIW